MGCCYSKPDIEREKLPPANDTEADGLSYVADAAYQLLRTKHAKHHNLMWNISKTRVIGSLLATPKPSVFHYDSSDAVIRKTGSSLKEYVKQFENGDTRHSDWFVDNMCNLMCRTTMFCDLMSLAAPDGYFLEKIKAALKNICINAERTSKPIIIRMMFGNVVGRPINCDRLRNKLTEDLPLNNNIQLWVGAWRYGASWNHAKIIAVDGKYLICGGHNMWTKIYLRNDPVHDLSIEMEGPATVDAHLFANTQWRFIEKKQVSKWNNKSDLQFRQE